MVKLQDTLVAQGNLFLDQFIKDHGISYLLDVHEDLLWRFDPPNSMPQKESLNGVSRTQSVGAGGSGHV